MTLGVTKESAKQLRQCAKQLRQHEASGSDDSDEDESSNSNESDKDESSNTDPARKKRKVDDVMNSDDGEVRSRSSNNRVNGSTGPRRSDDSSSNSINSDIRNSESSSSSSSSSESEGNESVNIEFEKFLPISGDSALKIL